MNAYIRIFLRISQGASRLQEVMADRWAAQAYGSRAFMEGLAQVVRRSVFFEAQANAAIRRSMEMGQPLTNLFIVNRLSPEDLADVSQAQAAALSRPGSPHDSHPPPADRIAWVQALDLPKPPGESAEGEPAWSLLEDRHAIEERLTEGVGRMLGGAGG